MTEHFNRQYEHSYKELLKLAAAALRRDPRARLSPATLVHEAWLHLVRTPSVADTSPAHFKAIAARAMRQILVDTVRRRSARRRGGPGLFTVSLNEALVAQACSGEQMLDVDAALIELRSAGKDGPRMETAAVLRLFGGCTDAEIAAVLEVHETTVERDWRFAKAWLKSKLIDAEK
jgi:RNA polymerase sigma factor (TIGR02999 family)